MRICINSWSHIYLPTAPHNIIWYWSQNFIPQSTTNNFFFIITIITHPKIGISRNSPDYYIKYTSFFPSQCLTFITLFLWFHIYSNIYLCFILGVQDLFLSPIYIRSIFLILTHENFDWDQMDCLCTHLYGKEDVLNS